MSMEMVKYHKLSLKIL